MLIRLIADPADEHRSGANQMRQWLSFPGAFLAEVRQLDKKNLAIEALKKLINGTVRSQAARNVVQARSFSERLDAAIARYHANALTTAQVLEELIELAKDIRAARARVEES